MTLIESIKAEDKFKSAPLDHSAAVFNITYHPRNFCVWDPVNPTDRYSDYRAQLQGEYRTWMRENIRHPWRLITTALSEQAILCFMNGDDAMLFKLTWL